jgi:membrane-bound ClpP family serine protease
LAEPNQALQLAGAALILLAFLALQLGRTVPERPAYLGSNLVGATLLAIEAGRTGQLGFLALEGVWALVSGAALVRTWSRSRPPR